MTAAEHCRAEQIRMSRRMAYRYQWTAPRQARVFHPVYGEATVPCRSKYAALLCAAEVWECDWTEVREAEVFAI